MAGNAWMLIAASAVCSVAVGVLLKLAPRWRLDAGQLVTWNYLAASLLCAGLLAPPMATLREPGTPWAVLLTLGLVLPSLFLVLAASVREAGIVRTDVAQRLSLLLSLVAAFTLFGEHAAPLKLTGLGLGLLAVAGIVARPGSGPAQTGRSASGLLLVVWAGFALVDVMLKHVAQAGTPLAVSLQASFALAFVLMLARQLHRHLRGRNRIDLRHLAGGLVLGLLNFGNIYFYVRAHQAMPESPAVVFAAMNIGVVVLGTGVGVVAFGERPGRWAPIAIPLAVVSIVLIGLA